MEKNELVDELSSSVDKCMRESADEVLRTALRRQDVVGTRIVGEVFSPCCGAPLAPELMLDVWPNVVPVGCALCGRPLVVFAGRIVEDALKSATEHQHLSSWYTADGDVVLARSVSDGRVTATIVVDDGSAEVIEGGRPWAESECMPVSASALETAPRQ